MDWAKLIYYSIPIVLITYILLPIIFPKLSEIRPWNSVHNDHFLPDRHGKR